MDELKKWGVQLEGVEVAPDKKSPFWGSEPLSWRIRIAAR
jgi:hypothetical protein